MTELDESSSQSQGDKTKSIQCKAQNMVSALKDRTERSRIEY